MLFVSSKPNPFIVKAHVYPKIEKCFINQNQLDLIITRTIYYIQNFKFLMSREDDTIKRKKIESYKFVVQKQTTWNKSRKGRSCRLELILYPNIFKIANSTKYPKN